MIGRGKTDAHFTDVFVSRAMKAPGGSDTVCPVHAERAECFAMHRIEWQATRLSADSQKIIWHFRAPDAESVRMALRRAGIAFDEVWAGEAPAGSAI